MHISLYIIYLTGCGLYGVRLYDLILYGGAVQNRTLRREKSTAFKKTGLYGGKYYFPIFDQNRYNFIFNQDARYR